MLFTLVWSRQNFCIISTLKHAFICIQSTENNVYTKIRLPNLEIKVKPDQSMIFGFSPRMSC